MSRQLLLVVLLSAVSGGPAFAVQPSEALQTATKNGQPAVVLVIETGAQNLEAAQKTGRAAVQLVQGSVLVELNRSEHANAQFVTRYGLAGAPVPLFLVFARNGALAGGALLAQATPAGLARMVPSPKKAEVLKALQGGSAVLLMASRKGMGDKSKAMNSCAAACGQVKGKSTTVAVDMDDPAEVAFLQEISVDPKATAPTTIVLNAQGQIAGTFSGVADVGALVAAATRKAGGCCGSGAGKSCPPPKKG